MKKLITLSILAILAVAAPLSAAEMERSDSDMLADAEKGVAGLEDLIANIQSSLEDARKDGDVAKMDCLNTLLVNARGFLTVTQNGQANLSDAISRHDEEAKKHHYKLVQLGANKGTELGNRVRECSSGVVGLSGTTIQETRRVCSVEPCLSGEEYYEPSKLGVLGAKSEQPGANNSGSDLDVDASAYF